MKKTGWVLLAGSIVAAYICFVVFGLLGGLINANASDYYSNIGAIIGFMAPSIVYFGNRI